MFGGILHRMILWELIKVFAMALLGITGILLMAGIVAEASQEGLGPAQILAAIPLLIPSTLPYTIPATTLFACCVVYGRLAADNEILAIKSSGVNILKVVGPGLLLGLAASAATMALYADVIPMSHRTLRALAFNDAEELLYSMLRRQGSINIPSLPYAIGVKGIEGRKMLDVTIEGRNENGQVNFAAQAKEAELHVDMAQHKLFLTLRNGNAVSGDDNSNIVFADTPHIVEVSLPPNFGPDGVLRARDMTWNEIRTKQQEWAQIAAKYDEAIRAEGGGAAVQAPAPAELFPDAPAPGPKTIDRLRAERDYVQQQIVWLNVELLMRPALSLGCFCFVLVGCPVGIWFSRSDYLSSFIVCFLPIVIIYYPLMLCGTGMAKEGHIDPSLPVWGANLFVTAVGAGLFWRLLRN